MQLGSAPIGTGSGHIAGRQLLQRMYAQFYGKPLPPIAVTERGKPFFTDGGVYFSISHTPKTVFCVLSDKPVGIDAEQCDRPIKPELAEKILSPGELRRYHDAADKRETLLRFWVLKEAAAKCSGEGLRGYPNHTDFSPDDPRITILDGCFVAVIEKQEAEYAL